MIKNVVEKAVVPYNPSSNKIINKDKYNLFAPMATKDLKGIASFDENDFNVLSGKVSLKYNKDKMLEEGDKRFFKLTKFNLFTGSLDDLKTPGSYYVTDGVVFVIYNSVYDVYFQYHISVDGDISVRHTNTIEKSWTPWFELAFNSSVENLDERVTKLTERLNDLVISSQTDIFTLVEVLPETGLTNKIYLVPIADGENPNVFDEWFWVNDDWEYLGQSGLNIDLSDYVKFTDIASNTKAGVLKILQSNGFTMDGSFLKLITATKEDVNGKSNTVYPLTSVFIDLIAMSGLADCKQPELWTDDTTDENGVTVKGTKTKARETIGAVKEITSKASLQRAYGIDIDGKQKLFNTSVNPSGDALVRFGSGGVVRVGNPQGGDTDAVNLAYLKSLAETWTFTLEDGTTVTKKVLVLPETT